MWTTSSRHSIWCICDFGTPCKPYGSTSNKIHRTWHDIARNNMWLQECCIHCKPLTSQHLSILHFCLDDFSNPNQCSSLGICTTSNRTKSSARRDHSFFDCVCRFHKSQQKRFCCWTHTFHRLCVDRRPSTVGKTLDLLLCLEGVNFWELSSVLLNLPNSYSQLQHFDGTLWILSSWKIGILNSIFSGERWTRWFLFLLLFFRIRGFSNVF